MTRYFILVFILCCSGFSFLKATEVACQVRFLYDPDQKLNEHSVLSFPFQEIPYSESFGLVNGNYWFQVLIEENSVESEKVILQIPAHNVGDLLVYKRVNDKLKHISREEKTLSVIHSRFPTFSFETKNEEQLEYYLNVNFHKEANFPVRVYAIDDYYAFSYRHHIFTGLYYGFLFAIVICNFFFFLKFSEKVYLYYLVFLCTYTVAILFRDGSMNFIFSNDFFIDLECVSHLLTQITMFLFAFVFLDFKTHVPRFKRYALALVIGMVLMEITYLTTGNFLFYAIADSIAMLSFFITWLICFLFMRKIKFTRFYLLGYSILLVFGFHFLFSYDFGLIPNNGRTLFLKIASITDMLIFTYAISYRMDILNIEYRDKIKELRAMLSDLQERLGDSSFYALLEKNSITNEALTIQELKVLKCIHQGYVNREIAEQLFVSTNTIKFHVRNIYKKLNVSSRREANDKLEKLNLQHFNEN